MRSDWRIVLQCRGHSKPDSFLLKHYFQFFLYIFSLIQKKSFFLWAERASLSLLIGSSLENRAAITEQLESNLDRAASHFFAELVTLKWD